MKSFKFFTLTFLSISLIISQTVEVYFGELDLQNNTVIYDSPVELGGVQFDITGGIFTGANGGSASDVGWIVNTSETTWLGFSFSGDGLLSGLNTLTTISFEALGEELCLSNTVFSDVPGSTLGISIGACISISSTEGCTDINALNYNSNATTDNNSCLYDPYEWIQSTAQSLCNRFIISHALYKY